MFRDPAYSRTGSLFAGHAGGAYSLPDELADAQHLAGALVDRLRRPGLERKLAATRGQYVTDLRAAIAAGAELPDPLVLRQAAEHDLALEELHRILGEEAEVAQTRVVGIMQRLAGTILVRHLRPALEETVAATRQAADELGGVLPSHDAIVSASGPERKAWLALEVLSARYLAIRAAQRTVTELTEPPQYDTRGLFGEFTNLADVWPDYSNPKASKPWPTTDRGRMMWIATSGAEPWLPTPAEQDAAFAARFPKAPALRGLPAGSIGELDEALVDA